MAVQGDGPAQGRLAGLHKTLGVIDADAEDVFERIKTHDATSVVVRRPHLSLLIRQGMRGTDRDIPRAMKGEHAGAAEIVPESIPNIEGGFSSRS